MSFNLVYNPSRLTGSGREINKPLITISFEISYRESPRDIEYSKIKLGPSPLKDLN